MNERNKKKPKAPISRQALAPMAAMSWPNNTFRQIKGLYTIRLQKKIEFEAFVICELLKFL